VSTLSKSKKFLLVERTHGVSFGLCLDVIMNTHRSNVIFGISNVIFIAIKKKRESPEYAGSIQLGTIQTNMQIT